MGALRAARPTPGPAPAEALALTVPVPPPGAAVERGRGQSAAVPARPGTKGAAEDPAGSPPRRVARPRPPFPWPRRTGGAGNVPPLRPAVAAARTLPCRALWTADRDYRDSSWGSGGPLGFPRLLPAFCCWCSCSLLHPASAFGRALRFRPAASMLCRLLKSGAGAGMWLDFGEDRARVRPGKEERVFLLFSSCCWSCFL